MLTCLKNGIAQLLVASKIGIDLSLATNKISAYSSLLILSLHIFYLFRRQLIPFPAAFPGNYLFIALV
jgi:hypothetical protein